MWRSVVWHAHVSKQVWYTSIFGPAANLLMVGMTIELMANGVGNNADDHEKSTMEKASKIFLAIKSRYLDSRQTADVG